MRERQNEAAGPYARAEARLFELGEVRVDACHRGVGMVLAYVSYAGDAGRAQGHGMVHKRFGKGVIGPGRTGQDAVDREVP
ncbi:hypothetical protein K7395_15330 [Streptomyces filamentosus]|uniref:Uncharacterized protein n=1 Tax=Streptomyces filamentosus TaxID=67294 RepID=A0ABY4UXG4_STRFL|nr:MULTISPECIES: hypothetical protein [Streptomyces]MYR80460.1 hypothetical protein [Streptomyces sp. SID5466]USC48020.1 hypothetical protein K7395_15330 [Streptomyces filamentosus]